MRAYYNEIDPYAAQWLRNLIDAGHIAPGDVDERSIVDVQPDDLRGYTQCHFFAGIGGWSLALRLAGWPDDRPVWTGSCPCQPFSAAGAQRGSDDERHLWPAFFRLIGERRPAVVFGEQVAGAAGLAWLDHVCADLEGAGYAAAAANLCAAGAGAFHIRQRLYWVADAAFSADERGIARANQRPVQARDERDSHGLADTGQKQRGRWPNERQPWSEDAAVWSEAAVDDQRCGSVGRMADLPEQGRGAQPQRDGGAHGRPEAQSRRLRDAGLLGNAGNEGLARREWFRGIPGGACGTGEGQAAERASLHADPWSAVEWIACSDGKARPTQPGLFPLAHGIPNRVGRLRAYGNAIVPQVAAAFIEAARAA
jgi:DNA (cytosine-5)-methyltransferase 1